MKKLIKKQNGGLVEKLLEENEKSKWMTQYPTTKYDRKPAESIAEKYRRFKNTPIESSNLTSYGLPIPELHHTSTPKEDIETVGTASLVPTVAATGIVGGLPALGSFALSTTVPAITSSIGRTFGDTEAEKEMYGDIGAATGMFGFKPTFNTAKYTFKRGKWYAPFEYMIAHTIPGKRAIELGMRSTNNPNPVLSIKLALKHPKSRTDAFKYILTGNKKYIRGDWNQYNGNRFIRSGPADMIDAYLYGKPLPFKEVTGYGVHDSYVKENYPNKKNKSI